MTTGHDGTNRKRPDDDDGTDDGTDGRTEKDGRNGHGRTDMAHADHTIRLTRLKSLIKTFSRRDSYSHSCALLRFPS